MPTENSKYSLKELGGLIKSCQSVLKKLWTFEPESEGRYLYEDAFFAEMDKICVAIEVEWNKRNLGSGIGDFKEKYNLAIKKKSFEFEVLCETATHPVFKLINCYYEILKKYSTSNTPIEKEVSIRWKTYQIMAAAIKYYGDNDNKKSTRRRFYDEMVKPYINKEDHVKRCENSKKGRYDFDVTHERYRKLA